ncbi:unnamed protein product [Aphanomyces euteiches]
MLFHLRSAVRWQRRAFSTSSLDLIALIKSSQADIALETLSDGASCTPQTMDWATTDAYGSTALTLAARGGHIALCQAILPHVTPDVLNQANMFGSTALMCASASGHAAVCKVLLETGADIQVRTRYGSTALSKAAEAGHDAIVTLLLVKGAEPTANVMGKTPWDLAMEKGHILTAAPSVQNEAQPVSARVTRIISSAHVECVLASDGSAVIVTKQENRLVPVNAEVRLVQDDQGSYRLQELVSSVTKQRCLHPRRAYEKKCVDCPERR